MKSLESKYYVDATGRYLGAYGGIQHEDIVVVNDEGVEVRTPGLIEYPQLPGGAIEVPNPPVHRLDHWNGTHWEQYVPPPPDLDEELNQRDPVIRALVALVPGGAEAVKAEVAKLSGRGMVS